MGQIAKVDLHRELERVGAKKICFVVEETSICRDKPFLSERSCDGEPLWEL